MTDSKVLPSSNLEPLKPCPFCGSQPIKWEHRPDWYRCSAPSCVLGGMHTTITKERWNGRAPLSAAPAQLACSECGCKVQIAGVQGHYEECSQYVRLAPAQPADEDPIAEVWHYERKVSIYRDEIMRAPGDETSPQIWEPRTLESVQKAFDWLYAAQPEGAAGSGLNPKDECGAAILQLGTILSRMPSKNGRWALEYAITALQSRLAQQSETFARQPQDCPHEFARITCADCGIDFPRAQLQEKASCVHDYVWKEEFRYVCDKCGDVSRDGV